MNYEKEIVRGSEERFPEISVGNLNERIERGEEIFLLDVREAYEYEIANLKGHLIPLGYLAQRHTELDRTREIIVYCHHGNRSAYAVEFLRNLGFEKVYNLSGGIDAWSSQVDSKIPRY